MKCWTGKSIKFWVPAPPWWVSDLHQLRSDRRLRDRYVRGSMFPDHPTAVFTLQELGILPRGLADGQEVEAQITGVLNIQGADFSLMFDVTTQDRGRLRCPSP